MRAFWRILIVTFIIFLIFIFWSLVVDTMHWAITGLALITVSVIWLACVLSDKRPFYETGFTLNIHWFRDLIAGIIIAAVSMSIMMMILWSFGYLTFAVNHSGMFDREFFSAIIRTLFLMIAVSIWEESYFRAYLILNLKEGLNFGIINRKYALLLAVLVASIIFSFAHTSNPHSTTLSFLNIAFAGIVFAYPYIYSKSLAISVGLHLSWNYFQGVVFGMPVSGLKMDQSILISRIAEPEILTGGQFGPEGGAIGFFGLILMALLCSFYLRIIYKK